MIFLSFESQMQLPISDQ